MRGKTVIVSINYTIFLLEQHILCKKIMLHQIIRVVFTAECAKSVHPHSSRKEITQTLNLFLKKKLS